MQFKQLIQILCVLAGIAIVAYSSNALTPNLDVNVPQNLTIRSASDFGLILRWDAPQPDVNVRQYFVYKNTGPIEEGHEELLFTKTTSTSFGDGTVFENTTYFYRVRAEYNDGNFSSLSNEVSKKTGRLTQSYLDATILDTFAGSTDSLNLTIIAPSDNETHDVTIHISNNREGLFISTENDDFTLNSGERTDVAINVTSQDSLEDGSYAAEVWVTESGITRKLPFTVRIGGSTYIKFEGGGQNFCNSTYLQDIPITIQNNSPDDFLNEQPLRVSASSDLFGPVVSPTDFNLYRGQTKNATVRINVDPNAYLVGHYFVTLTATQDDQNWKSVARIDFSLKDCNSSDLRDFTMGFIGTTPNGTWIKGKAYDVNFTLRSAGTSFDQDVDINVETSPFVPASFITRLRIPGNGSVKGSVTFYPQLNTIPGDFNFKIVANNGNLKREIKVERNLKIGALNQFTLNVTRDNIQIIEDYPSDIEFNIQNGDSVQTFNLSASGSEGISVTNIPTVTVQPRSNQNFTIRVYAKPGVTGNKQITLTAQTNGLATQSKTINITVNPNTSQTRDAIHILAYPSLIQTDVNKTQEVVFTLENATELEMNAVSISVSGLPEGASMNSLSDITLRPHYPQNVTGMLITNTNTPRGRYEVQFTVQQGRYVTRVKGFLEVGTIHNDSILNDVSTGLASLGQNWQVGLFVILAIIGGLFILSKIGQAISSPKERWMK